MEILGVIASVSMSMDVYRGMLTVPLFARAQTPNSRVDFMILFGHRVEITARVIQWFRHGEIHRLDGPAVTIINSNPTWGGPHYCDTDRVDYMWYRNGLKHRVGGPAVVYGDGEQYWYRNGLRHRDDGPAIVYPSGASWWIRNGKLYRKDGPTFVKGVSGWFRKDMYRGEDPPPRNQ